MKTKLYHRTARRNLGNILKEGLRRGSETLLGERLPFVMFTRQEPKIETGRAAHIEVEIDDEEKAFVPVNRLWVEVHRNIDLEEITAFAAPPRTNEEVFQLIDFYDGDLSHPGYRKHWKFQPASEELE